MTREEFIKSFKVGDKIRLKTWYKESYIAIDHIGHDMFVGTGEEENESHWRISDDHDWQPYQEPKKMITVYKYRYFSGGRWRESGTYYKRDHDFMKFNRNKSNYKRLDNTAIEVEEY